MQPNITSEQQNTLDTWATQRDVLLRENSQLSSEKEVLLKENTSLSESNSHITSEIESKKSELAIITGELENKRTLTDTEKGLLDREIALKREQVAQLNIDINYYEGKRQLLIDEVLSLSEAISNIGDKYGSLNITVEKIMRINNDNIDKFNLVISDTIKKLSG